MLLTIEPLFISVFLLSSDWDCQETKHHLCTSHSLPFTGGKCVWLTSICRFFTHYHSSLFIYFWQAVSSWIVFVCFTASAAGGSSCGTSQTGDYGRAKCCHRGTWTARSSTYSVYFSNFSSLILVFWVKINFCSLIW